MMKSIFNFQFFPSGDRSILNSVRRQRGFTLVELLASVIVLVAIGSVVAGIITSSLRGANKTNTIENIRQNGNYVLNQMSKNIASSQPFDGDSTGFITKDDTGALIHVTSCPATFLGITVKSTNNIPITYSCSDDSDLKSNTDSLLDPSVSLQECSLTCTQTKVTDVPIIGISFTLVSNSSSSLAEKSGSIKFETSVTMRNYKK